MKLVGDEDAEQSLGCVARHRWTASDVLHLSSHQEGEDIGE